MQDLNDLYYYVKVIDSGGFAAAGRALSIPKSKLSRRIANLEERLGVQLIQRTTRSFHVTEVGQQYYNHCNAMLVEAEAAQQSIERVHAEPCGVIRMSCPIGLLNFHVGEMMADFMAKNPGVTLRLEATNRRVELVNEGFDLAIRVRPFPLEDSDLAIRVLSDRGQCLVASPALVANYGQPQQPADLSAFPSLANGTTEETFEWKLHGPNDSTVAQRYTPRYVTTDMFALHQAALSGIGVVQLPHLMVGEDIAAGRLLNVLPNWAPKREVIHIVFHSRRGLLPSVRAAIEHLAAAYAAFDED